MMFKALAALTLILVATDYAITGGNYSGALVSGVFRFFRWLIQSGTDSIFSR
jgi:hypothetical protein